MFNFRWVLRSTLAFLVMAVLATTVMSGESPKPSGKVSMESRAIAAGVGVTWGDGKLSFKGKDYPFSIDGLTVVDIGISKASATGDVYHLTDVAKFRELMWLLKPGLPSQAAWAAWCCAIRRAWLCTYARHREERGCN